MLVSAHVWALVKGYSFALSDAITDEAVGQSPVGQIGLWLREIEQGRATPGYWIAPQFRRRGFAREVLSF